MKKITPVLVLSFALSAFPALAQQGPAGVPGAPLIGASIAPPPASSMQKATPRKRARIDCNKARNPEQCKAKQEARRQAREACKGRSGTQRTQCIRDQLSQAR